MGVPPSGPMELASLDSIGPAAEPCGDGYAPEKSGESRDVEIRHEDNEEPDAEADVDVCANKTHQLFVFPHALDSSCLDSCKKAETSSSSEDEAAEQGLIDSIRNSKMFTDPEEKEKWKN